MIFTINCPTFIEISNTILKGYNSKDNQSQAVFKVIKNSEQNELLVKTRSQTSFFKGTIPILSLETDDNIDNLEWGVDGNQLKTIISILPKFDCTLKFTMSNSNRLFTIECNDSIFKLPVFETPIFQNEEPIQNVAAVLAVDFMNNISNLGKLCSTIPTHQEHQLSCLHLFLENNKIIYMATNSVAIAEIKQDASQLDTDLSEFTCLLKPAQSNLLISNSYDGSEVIKLIKTNTMFGYIDKNNVLCLVAIADINPLSYGQILSLASEEQKIEFNKEDFKHAIDSLSKLCTTNDELQLFMKDNSFVIENENKDKFVVATESKFEDTEMKLLKTPLSNLVGLMEENVEMCWSNTSQKRIIKFKSLDKDRNAIENIFMGITSNDK